MTIKNLLHKFIPTNEIMSRINSKQILINQRIITKAGLNNELNINDDYIDLGNFLCTYWNTLTDTQKLVYNTFNIDDFFGNKEQTNIDCLKYLSNYLLLRLSKKEKYVFEYKSNILKSTV